MSEAVKTQGTELYFIDTVSSSTGIMKMACPTGITGLGGAADQIDTTCLDASERTFSKGLANPGQVSVPFVFKPGEASHQVLFDLKDDGSDIDWMICLSDGIDPPTMDMEDKFVAPSDRTSFAFIGYVSDLNIDLATNEVVRGTLTIQRSGGVTLNLAS